MLPEHACAPNGFQKASPFQSVPSFVLLPSETAKDHLPSPPPTVPFRVLDPFFGFPSPRPYPIPSPSVVFPFLWLLFAPFFSPSFKAGWPILSTRKDLCEPFCIKRPRISPASDEYHLAFSPSAFFNLHVMGRLH